MKSLHTTGMGFSPSTSPGRAAAAPLSDSSLGLPTGRRAERAAQHVGREACQVTARQQYFLSLGEWLFSSTLRSSPNNQNLVKTLPFKKSAGPKIGTLGGSWLCGFWPWCHMESHGRGTCPSEGSSVKGTDSRRPRTVSGTDQ